MSDEASPHPYQELKRILDATPVVSDSFKGLILSYAMACAERGAEIERARLAGRT